MTARPTRTRPALLALAGLAAAPALLTAPAGAAQDDAGPEGRYVVQLEPGADLAASVRAVGAGADDVQVTLRHAITGGVVELTAGEAAQLRDRPGVTRVEADRPVRATATQAGATWGLDRIDQRALPLSTGFEHGTTGAGVTAYVVDTGVRPDHVQLAGRVVSGFTAIGDGGGTNDCNGHGTHVAGTIAGTTHGVAKAATVVPVRVLGCDGFGWDSGIITALDWVVAHHQIGYPAVLNMSLGGGASQSFDDAVERVVADGVTVVVSAGNSNVDACGVSPARAPRALTVGATTSTDARAGYSNTGTCLDLFAPGSGIASAWWTSATATATLNGTSMASPHVAGAVAALLEAEPTLTPDQVASRLLSTATTGAVTDPGAGSANRLLWADPALTPAAGGPTPPMPPSSGITAPAAPAAPTVTAGTRSAVVRWTAGADGGSPIIGQTLRAHRYDSAGTRRTVATIELSAGLTSATVTGLLAGTYHAFTVTETNGVGTSPLSAYSAKVLIR